MSFTPGTNSTSVSQLRGCWWLLVVVAFVRDDGGIGGLEGFRGHGGVTPRCPLSYLPLHLLPPLTPFENTTLGFHHPRCQFGILSGFGETTEWRQYFARLIVFIAPTRPSWFMSLELHVLQQLPGINIHVLLPGKRTAVTQEPRDSGSASLRSNTLTQAPSAPKAPKHAGPLRQVF